MHATFIEGRLQKAPATTRYLAPSQRAKRVNGIKCPVSWVLFSAQRHPWFSGIAQIFAVEHLANELRYVRIEGFHVVA